MYKTEMNAINDYFGTIDIDRDCPSPAGHVINWLLVILFVCFILCRMWFCRIFGITNSECIIIQNLCIPGKGFPTPPT